MTSKDRAIRLEAHKLHVISLLASARIRNRWASNSLLKVGWQVSHQSQVPCSYPRRDCCHCCLILSKPLL